MKLLVTISTALLLSACATMPRDVGAPEVKLRQGSQLHIWGIDVRSQGQDWVIAGYVDRTALPRGLLNEHVDVAIESPGSPLNLIGTARLSSPAALRERGTSAFHAQAAKADLLPPASILLSAAAGAVHREKHD